MSTKDRRPWMKFRPDRWLGDVELGMCSLAAQGLWIRCISLMHLSYEYGCLLIGNKPATTELLARAINADITLIGSLLWELESNGVLSRRESDNCIVSRRMLADHEISEKGRADIDKRWKEHRKTVLGKTPCPPPNSKIEIKIEKETKKRVPPKVPLKSKSEDEQIPLPPSKRGTGCVTFDAAWRAWPQKGRSSKAKALALWRTRPEPTADLGAAVTRYLATSDARKQGGEFVPAFERWLRDRLDSFLEISAADVSAADFTPDSDLPDWWSEIGARISATPHAGLWSSYLKHCEIITREPLTLRPKTGTARDVLRQADETLVRWLGDNFVILDHKTDTQQPTTSTLRPVSGAPDRIGHPALVNGRGRRESAPGGPRKLSYSLKKLSLDDGGREL